MLYVWLCIDLFTHNLLSICYILSNEVSIMSSKWINDFPYLNNISLVEDTDL